MTKRGSTAIANATFPRNEKEAVFFAEIARSPSDEDARSVYADWLEERSDTAYAESLRIDSMLSRRGRSCAEIKTLAKRLLTLRARTAPDWRTAVLRWSTEKDFTPFALKDAIAKIKSSKHAGAPKVAKVVRDWVESREEIAEVEVVAERIRRACERVGRGAVSGGSTIGDVRGGRVRRWGLHAAHRIRGPRHTRQRRP